MKASSISTEFGPIIVAVPADPALAPTMTLAGFLAEPAKELSYIEDIRPYRSWMPIVTADELVAGTVKATPKPPTHYAVQTAIGIISDSLREKGLADGVIAVGKAAQVETTVA